MLARFAPGLGTPAYPAVTALAPSDWKTRLRVALGYRLGLQYMYAPRPIQLPAPAAYAALESVAGPANAAPKISVVTPVRNQAAFIAQTMDSVLSQSYAPAEYIVIDGASADGTTQIVETYRHRLTFFSSAPDSGQSEAINRGFAHATGEILGWLNGDDLLLPGALAAIATVFASNPQIDALYGDRLIIDARGDEIGRWVLPAHSDRLLSWLDFVPQESLYWRRSAWDRIGARIDTTFRFAMDWDLLLRLRDSGARIVHVPRLLGAFRAHPAQKTAAQMEEVGREEIRRIQARYLGFVPSPARLRMAMAPYVIRHMLCDLRARVSALPPAPQGG
jgi:GT2 family glycosyltransferase